MSPGRYDDWNLDPMPMLVRKGTPEEKAAAIRCLERLSRAVHDGADGLRTVIAALGLDEETTT